MTATKTGKLTFWIILLDNLAGRYLAEVVITSRENKMATFINKTYCINVRLQRDGIDSIKCGQTKCLCKYKQTE